MPRPKPPEPLKGREIRLSDTQMAKFKSLGGSKWLRDFLDQKETPCPTVVTSTEPAPKPKGVLSVWRHIIR
jgi:hypothetical protein